MPDTDNLAENQNYVVEDLFKLPAKNLEDRIRESRTSIKKRKRISDEILTGLGTRRRRLGNHKKRLRYAELTNIGAGRIRDVEQQLSMLEQAIHQELVSCFRDVRSIEETIQQDLADLAIERVKLNLLDSE